MLNDGKGKKFVILLSPFCEALTTDTCKLRYIFPTSQGLQLNCEVWLMKLLLCYCPSTGIVWVQTWKYAWCDTKIISISFIYSRWLNNLKYCRPSEPYCDQSLRVDFLCYKIQNLDLSSFEFSHVCTISFGDVYESITHIVKFLKYETWCVEFYAKF